MCQMHTNEPPLWHLVEKLDGPTSGPKGFVGPFGQSLTTFHTLKIAKFKAIEYTSEMID